MADLNSLQDIFEDELRDVYDAEKQILKALPKVIKAVSSEPLQDALSEHLEQTRGHVERLEQAFESIELKPKGKHCAGMAGVLVKGASLLKENGGGARLHGAFIPGRPPAGHYQNTPSWSPVAQAVPPWRDHALAPLEEFER